MKRVEDRMNESILQKKAANQDKLYMALKALTAMKLTKEDSIPGQIFEDVYLGSIGCAQPRAADGRRSHSTRGSRRA